MSSIQGWSLSSKFVVVSEQKDESSARLGWIIFGPDVRDVLVNLVS